MTQAGAFVDALDDSGSSPLLLAASQRDFTMVTWKISGRRGGQMRLETGKKLNSYEFMPKNWRKFGGTQFLHRLKTHIAPETLEFGR